MSDRMRGLLIVIGAVVLVAAFFGLTHRSTGVKGKVIQPQMRADGTEVLSPADRAARLEYSPDVSLYDRGVIQRAIDDARPEARRLIDAVDGLVTVSVAPTPAGVVGVTAPAFGRYSIILNLGVVAAYGGQRGIDRVVLHELGHVVDFVLVPDKLRDEIDRQVPRGYGCEGGVTGACTAAEEVFADSFAKWASGDIGAGLSLAGYRIPPPADLEGWGRPLAALGTI
jgi:hypothetical protein